MIKEQKKQIRRKALACRNALTEPERERGKLLITERILGHQWYYLSDTILGFVSYGSEICTTEILESALQDGKASTFPKWKMENGVLSDVLSVRVEKRLQENPGTGRGYGPVSV